MTSAALKKLSQSFIINSGTVAVLLQEWV